MAQKVERNCNLNLTVYKDETKNEIRFSKIEAEVPFGGPPTEKLTSTPSE